MLTLNEEKNISENLISIAKFCADKNLVPATSGNFSARINSETILITQSGKDKGKLLETDLMNIDYSGKALNPEEKPSAETLLHTQIYRIFPEINYIAHFHSSSSAVISKILLKKGLNELKLNDFELLKALSGVTSHEFTEVLPIFANDQNIANLSEKVEESLLTAHATNCSHGYLLAGHGLYTWGKTEAETKRHVDALNTLIESYILELQLS